MNKKYCLKSSVLFMKEHPIKLNAKNKLSNDETMDAVSLKYELEQLKLKYKSILDQFESLFEMTNDAIFIVDFESEKFISANKKAADLFGFNLKDITQYSIGDFIHPEDLENSRIRLKSVKEGRIIPVYERRFVKLNGESFIGEVNLSLIEDSATGKSYIQSIIWDITGIKRADEVIKRDRVVFYEIAKAAVETIDIPEFCNRVLSTLLDKFNFDFGTIRVFNEKTKNFDPLAIHGLDQEIHNLIKPINASNTDYIISEVLNNKKPIYAEDISRIPSMKKFEKRIKLLKIKSFISWPILDKTNKILGTIQLCSSHSRRINQEDILFFESIIDILLSVLERFIAEKELFRIAKERKELQEIINMSPAVVFLWKNKNNWPVEYVSENVNIFGYSPEDFYSGKMTYRDLIHPEDTKNEKNDIDKNQQKTISYKYPLDYRIKCRDNTYKWVLEYSTPRYNSTGEISHYFGIILDISDRAKYEDYLKNERTALKVLAEATIQSITVKDLCQNILSELIGILGFERGSIRLFDPISRELTRIAEVHVTGEFSRINEIISIDNQDFVIPYVARTKKPIFAPKATEIEIQEKFKHALNNLGVKSFITWPLLGVNDELIGVMQIISNYEIDLVEEDKVFFESTTKLLATAIKRLQTEEELKITYNEREQLDQIINLSPATVFLWNNDPKWTVQFVSDNIIQFGYTQKEFQSGELPYMNIIHPDDLERVVIDVERYTQNPNYSDYTMQYRIITKSGAIRWVDEYTTIRRDELRNVEFFMGIIIDITERKKAEFALQSERRAFQLIADAAAIANNLPELCQYILNGLIDIFDFDLGTIRIYDENEKMLVPIAEVKVSEIFLNSEIPTLSIDDPNYVNSLVARTKKAIFAPDVKKCDLLVNYHKRLEEIKVRSLVTYPILDKKNELIGTLQLAANDPKNLLEEDHILFETIAETLSNNIERLLEMEARRESEEKFRAFAEQSLSGVMLFKNTGEFLFFNKQMENITEYKIEELMKLSIEDFLNMTFISKYSDIIKKMIEKPALTSNLPLTREFQLKTKTGLIKWILMYLTPINIRNEQAYAVLIIDITQQKQSQLALTRERELLKIISEATANNFYVNDLCSDLLKGLIKTLDLDAGSIRLFKEDKNQLVSIADFGLKDDEKYLLTPIIFEETKHPLIELLKQENMIFSLDSSTHPLLKSSPLATKYGFKTYIFWPIKSAKGTFIGTLQIGSRRISNLTDEDKVIFESITEIIATSIEHLQALEELRESQEKFKRTVDNITDGISIIENEELVYINERAMDIFGYTKEEIKEMKGFNFVAQESSDQHEIDKQIILLEPNKLHEKEYWFIRKDGTKRCVNNRHSIILKDDGNYSLYILSTDVTERKLAEEALQKLNEELEERVKERTLQLEQVNKELEAFSYSVSHDLRTPLRSIDGFSQVLLEDYSRFLDETGQDYVLRIRTSTKRMSNLIDDLLALSRLTRKELAIEQIDLTKLCNDIIDEFKINEPNRKIQISIEKGMIIYGDPSLIRTVLENLIGNAWKFTRKKIRPKIIIGTKTINKDKIYFIEDTGVGFDMAYANKLFAVFQRLHSYKEFEGTGVGLAIVQRIINRHGGKIWAEGKVNKGAIFYFTVKTNPKD
ncbi:MAG: PAS domain S-box protein [Asgard group archaeon]|nr:PAS domain S-box protein [Asgard group archaeon]